MRIIISTHDYKLTTGGGRISLKTLVERLETKHELFFLDAVSKENLGHGVDTPHYRTWRRTTRKLPSPQEALNIINEIRGSKELKNLCDEIKPDLVFVQGPKLTINSNIPQVLFVRDYNFGDIKAYTRLTGKMANFIPAFLRRRRLSRYSLVIANSGYLRDVLKAYNRNVEFVYPFVNFMDDIDFRDNSNAEYIGFVNPDRIKGIECFIEITRKMPNRKFVVAGTVASEFVDAVKSLPNVKSLGWVNEMGGFYNMLRLLLIPSKWPEPFGRIALEAGRLSVPSIASKRGGLPEAVGNGGLLVDEHENPDKWVQAIQALDDRELYAEKTLNAYKHSMQCSVDSTLEKLDSIISSQMGIDLCLRKAV